MIDEGVCVVEIPFAKNDQPTGYRSPEINSIFETLTDLTSAAGRRLLEIAPPDRNKG